MKRVALAIVSTITGLVLLLSFKTHALGSPVSPPAAVSSATTGNTGASATGSSSAATTGRKSATSPSGTSSTSGSAVTVTGAVASTIYGPIQVRITVKDGRVAAATAVEYPAQDPMDAQINYYAIPVLNREAVQASSANIAHVSGATYTSGGYVTSLQSALNKAGL